MGKKISCPLCDALEKERDSFLYSNPEIVIMPTLPYGNHKKRLMVVSRKHISPEAMDKTKEKDYVNVFLEFCKEYFKDEPVFYYGSTIGYTVKGHWHCVASDWDKELDRRLHYVMETNGV